jgi:hypothetical protein
MLSGKSLPYNPPISNSIKKNPLLPVPLPDIILQEKIVYKISKYNKYSIFNI